MLEIVVVWLLARHVGRVAAARGQKPLQYRWLTFGLWFGGELLGAIVAAVVLGNRADIVGVYAIALLTAITGGAVAWQAAKRAPINPDGIWRPNAITPPQGLPAWARPDARVPPIAILPGNAYVRVEDWNGDWARVATPNGWRGYVDARLLTPTAAWTPQTR